MCNSLERDTQNVDISWCVHAGGAGKLLQVPQVLHPAICYHSPTAASVHWDVGAGSGLGPRTRPFDI